MLAVRDVSAPHSEEKTAREPLSRRVERRLEESGYPELRNLNVSQGPHRILLEGKVRTYFLKQVAQTLVLSLPGVDAVENQIEVSGYADGQNAV